MSNLNPDEDVDSVINPRNEYYDSSIDNSPDQLEPTRPVLELHLPIYLETLTGTTFALEVMPDDTIRDIKMKLEDVEGIPASRQHIIWQEKELKNESTVHENGIGFGAILQLILKLKGGPIEKMSSFNDDEKYMTDESQSHPLTVLVFNDGKSIQMFALSANVMNASKNNNSEEEIQSNSSANSQSNSVINKQSEAQIEEEKNMRRKVKELQESMKKLLLKRKDKSRRKSLKNKLPDLEIPLNKKGSLNANINPNHSSNIHFPPINANSSSSSSKYDDSSHSKLKGIDPTSKEVKKSDLVKFIPSTKNEKEIKFKRCVSASVPPIKNTFEELKLAVGCELEASSCHVRRPKTSPISENFTLNTKHRSQNLFNLKALKKTSSDKNKMSSYINESSASSSKSSTQKLPSLRTIKAKKSRCNQCHRKLGITNTYECRCGSIYCAKHRYSETHDCSYDYKNEGKKYFQLNNPIVVADKLPKI